MNGQAVAKKKTREEEEDDETIRELVSFPKVHWVTLAMTIMSKEKVQEQLQAVSLCSL